MNVRDLSIISKGYCKNKAPKSEKINYNNNKREQNVKKKMLILSILAFAPFVLYQTVNAMEESKEDASVPASEASALLPPEGSLKYKLACFEMREAANKAFIVAISEKKLEILAREEAIRAAEKIYSIFTEQAKKRSTANLKLYMNYVERYGIDNNPYVELRHKLKRMIVPWDSALKEVVELYDGVLTPNGYQPKGLIEYQKKTN